MSFDEPCEICGFLPPCWCQSPERDAQLFAAMPETQEGMVAEIRRLRKERDDGMRRLAFAMGEVSIGSFDQVVKLAAGALRQWRHERV